MSCVCASFRHCPTAGPMLTTISLCHTAFLTPQARRTRGTSYTRAGAATTQRPSLRSNGASRLGNGRGYSAGVTTRLAARRAAGWGTSGEGPIGRALTADDIDSTQAPSLSGRAWRRPLSEVSKLATGGAVTPGRWSSLVSHRGISLSEAHTHGDPIANRAPTGTYLQSKRHTPSRPLPSLSHLLLHSCLSPQCCRYQRVMNTMMRGCTLVVSADVAVGMAQRATPVATAPVALRGSVASLALVWASLVRLVWGCRVPPVAIARTIQAGWGQSRAMGQVEAALKTMQQAAEQQRGRTM